MSNFFNAIGVADMEKVHSAMIAWILDDANDRWHKNYVKGKTNFSTLPIDKRSELLCELFNAKPTRKFDTIRTHVEWNDIDIMIITEKDNTKEIWVIENKLKSSEHMSNDDNGGKLWQTEKYVRIINKNDEYKNLDQHYLLLSLGGDKARYSETDEWKREYNHHEWKSITYKEMAMYLENAITQQSHTLIKEYLDAIKHLGEELANFLENPYNYPDVFAPKKTKANKAIFLSKLDSTTPSRYILENGLETIFQKQWLKRLVEIAKNNDNNLSDLYDKMIIDEDRGAAEFDYTIKELNENGVKQDGELMLQVQFQTGTFKVVVIHKKYRETENDPKHHAMIYNKGVWHEIFKNIDKNDGWTLWAKEQEGKKARISLTKKYIPKWYDYGKGREEVISRFIEGFNNAKQLAEDILKKVNN